MPQAHGEQRTESLVREALELFEEYQRTSDQSLLTRAVPVFRAALAAAERAGAPDIAAYHNNLAYALHLLAEATTDAATQAESVSHHRAAVAATGPDDLDRVPYLCTLSSGLRDLYGYTRSVELLHEAIQAATEAIDRHWVEPPLATQYTILADALGALYDHEPDPDVLSRVIAASREAAGYAEIFHDQDPARLWGNLGGWSRDRYALTGDVDALTEAVHYIRKAVAAASGDQRLRYLSNLGDTLRLCFERTGDLDALAEAVTANRTAAAGTWPGNPDLPRRASHLAGTLVCRYDRTGDVAALAEAITAGRQAVAAAPPGHAERGGYLTNLQVALDREWERTGDLAIMRESVNVAREAAAATPPGHHLRALCLTTLSGALQSMYLRTGDVELLTEAVQASRDALAVVPAGEPDRAPYLNNLGQSLGSLFGRTRDADALREAVQLTREALSATPADDPVLADRQAALSSLLDDLAGRTLDTGPLTEAVALAREAVAAVAQDDPRRAALLDDLGSALTSLFTRTRNSALLREAVRVRQEALAATPGEHTSRVGRLVSLAATLDTLATRTDSPDAAMDAAGLLEEALDALPDDHPGRAVCLVNLAEVYRTLYRRFPDPGSTWLYDAIRTARSSIEATPDRHPDLASRLALLSGLLLQRSAAGQQPAALDEALRLARQAVAATRPDDPDYPKHQDGLGWALVARHQAAAPTGGDPTAAAEAWRCFHDTATHPLASVGRRIGAYRRSAELAAEAGRTAQDALACIEAAVDLLPGVVPGELDRDDQEHEIGSVTHLAAHAAQAAITAGRPDLAIELLERTRGVLVAGDLDRRTGHDHHRTLSDRELGTAATGGPVVYVYASVVRCDALIVGPADPGGVRVIPLPITESDVWDKAERLMELVGLQPVEDVPDPTDPGVQREFLAILGWLRERVTGPVLAALGYDLPRAGERERPRIWWCPVGIFTFLPLHAASVDEVVSSYTFTSRSLRYARSQPPPSAGAASAPLIIAVPDAPGAVPLPGADLEATLIASAFPRALRLARPTRTTALAQLPGHPVVHFACHGGVDPDDPGHSQLVLYDYARVPLTVADISELRLAGGLAFLSACETAVTTVRLANEAVHLTGAFQLAGFQHVVGTLWEVADLASATLVEDFYASLTVPGRRGVIDVSRAAIALHNATRRLRDRFPDWPTLWAAHIHTGP